VTGVGPVVAATQATAGPPAIDAGQVALGGATLAALAAAWLGLAICLAETPWARRRPLHRRVAPHLPVRERTATSTPTARRWGATSAVLSPPVLALLDRMSRAVGADGTLQLRLQRADDDRSPSAFRAQQVAGAVVATCIGGVVALAASARPVATTVLLVASPIGWLVVSERRLDLRVRSQQQRIQLELPVVAEQLGVLVGAGFSLAAAVQRLGERTHGRTARELTLVSRSLRQGVPEADALRSWERRTGVDAVGRLVRVLSMHRDAGDLGRLVSAEARATRDETHRLLVEQIERRSQLVWIPVTVATLVPGLLLLAVPFIAALRQVSG
jgi:Flp pilus assembly protein TadB